MALMIKGKGPLGAYPIRLWEEMFHWPGLLEESSVKELKAVAADVYETEGEVVVELAIPGIKPEDISVNITGDTLSVSGVSKEEEEEKKKDYYQKQIHYGSFAQTVVLPTTVQPNKAEAHFNHGILKIVLPKTEEVKPKKIEIKVGDKNV